MSTLERLLDITEKYDVEINFSYHKPQRAYRVEVRKDGANIIHFVSVREYKLAAHLDIVLFCVDNLVRKLYWDLDLPLPE